MKGIVSPTYYLDTTESIKNANPLTHTLEWVVKITTPLTPEPTFMLPAPGANMHEKMNKEKGMKVLQVGVYSPVWTGMSAWFQASKMVAGAQSPSRHTSSNSYLVTCI